MAPEVASGLAPLEPALPEAGVSGFTVLLPVVPALADVSGLASVALTPAGFGGIALLPVAPGFSGASARTSCGRAEEPCALLPGRALLPVGPAFAGSDLTGSDAAGPDLAGSTFGVEAAADGSAGLPIALSAGRDESFVTSLAASRACSGDLPCSEDLACSENLPCSGDLAPSLAPSLGEVTGVRSIQPPHRRSVLP